ncbi:hypothetical protein BD413DRAFT_566552 [Trametes elegans]|nr:hypothetical protein BD413DRAFT_566552 [Trametes elegans]
MDNPQYYQPLSHALHAPLVSASHPSPRQQYASYTSHQQPTVTNGAGSGHREEEEEEEEDDDEVVEEELDHHDADHRQSASSHSSPRVNAAQPQSRSTGAPAPTAPADYHRQPAPQQDTTQHIIHEDGTEKRKPGRPRGSKNRKPRVSAGSTSKAPSNVAHPGFYQYPPAPPANMSQNQQFYEFQWRALNLCSEFYNAAEELVKAASPMVIAQCYQAGPVTKVDPLMMIADAKRVCDSLLANPSQLAGQPVPTTAYPGYGSMPPPPPPGSAGAAGSAPAPGAVITNPQTFVMPLNSSSMPPPNQPYYAPMYTAPPGSRYPTAPYYYPPPQGAAPYYPPPAQPATPATSASAPPAQSSPPPQPTPPAAQPAPSASAPVPANTGTISTFSAATGNAAPGGHQGTWSEEETDRLKRLAEQSREMGGPQNKGEIEWDWVIQQWGNSRTRHQILLKATSLGLKESTTRGTKRRREAEPTPETHPPPPPPQQQQSQPQQPPQQQQQPPPQQQQQQPQPQPHQPHQTQHQQQQQQQHQSHSQHHQQQHQQHHQHHQPPPPQPSASSVVSPARSPIISTPTSVNASPAMQPQRPPSSITPGTGIIAPGRTNSTNTAPSSSSGSMPWPMPTLAVNTPSPVMASATTDSRNSSGHYRPRPTQTTSYGAAAAAAYTNTRPPSSHGSTTHHQYIYPTNGAGSRRDSRA